MSKQQYTWLLALSAIAWQQSNEDDDGGSAMLALHHVYAQAGCFSFHSVESSNDELVAALFILLLIRYWICAKYCANLLVLLLVWREINAARFFPEAARNPRQIRAAALWAGLLYLCHSDHLPTIVRSACAHG